MTTAMARMNTSVGTMNSRADSATPHMLAAVITASTPRQSQTRSPYRLGKADVNASTPADTPTAAFST